MIFLCVILIVFKEFLFNCWTGILKPIYLKNYSQFEFSIFELGLQC